MCRDRDNRLVAFAGTSEDFFEGEGILKLMTDFTLKESSDEEDLIFLNIGQINTRRVL